MEVYSWENQRQMVDFQAMFDDRRVGIGLKRGPTIVEKMGGCQNKDRFHQHPWPTFDT